MPFTNEDKVKMFERLGSLGAVMALILVVLIETGIATGENLKLADMGLTAMIVVLAVSLVGSVYFKSKRKDK